jgi:hypothetical protein
LLGDGRLLLVDDISVRVLVADPRSLMSWYRMVRC